MSNQVIARALQAEKEAEEESLRQSNRSKSIQAFNEIKEALKYQETIKNPIKVGKEAASRYSTPRAQNQKIKALPNPPIFDPNASTHQAILKQLESDSRQNSEHYY